MLRPTFRAFAHSRLQPARPVRYCVSRSLSVSPMRHAGVGQRRPRFMPSLPAQARARAQHSDGAPKVRGLGLPLPRCAPPESGIVPLSHALAASPPPRFRPPHAAHRPTNHTPVGCPCALPPVPPTASGRARRSVEVALALLRRRAARGACASLCDEPFELSTRLPKRLSMCGTAKQVGHWLRCRTVYVVVVSGVLRV